MSLQANSSKIVSRWLRPEEIRANIKDQYSVKQEEILKDLSNAPRLDDPKIAENLARQFTEYGLATIKLPGIEKLREESFKVSEDLGSSAKREEMKQIARDNPAIDYFPPVGEGKRTIVLANRKINNSESISGISDEYKQTLGETFKTLEEAGLKIVDHLNGWLTKELKEDKPLEPFKTSLKASTETKLGLNHLEASPDGAPTIAPHYDYGAMTLLPQGSKDGLEFYYDNKKSPEDSGWVRVKNLAKDIVLVQAGQMLDIVTRGKFSPMLHQVKPDDANKNESRDSVVLFMQPRKDLSLDSLKIKSLPEQISGFEAKFKEYVKDTVEFTSKNFSLFMNFMRRMRDLVSDSVVDPAKFFKADKLPEVAENYKQHGLEKNVDQAFLRNEINKNT